MVRIERTLRVTRDGGSCASCSSDYSGAPAKENRGKRVLAEVEPGLVEPVNLCPDCWEREVAP